MTLATVFFFAAFVEGLTKFIFSEWLHKYTKYVALAIAIVVSLLYKLDLLAEFGITSPSWWVGSVFTGIIIGRGSNYVNDVWTWFKKEK